MSRYPKYGRFWDSALLVNSAHARQAWAEDEIRPKWHPKFNVPSLANQPAFRYTDRMMMGTAQRQNYLKAKVALALYSEYGQVPKEAQIDRVYHLTRVLYKAVLGTHYVRQQQKKSGQLVLF